MSRLLVYLFAQTIIRSFDRKESSPQEFSESTLLDGFIDGKMGRPTGMNVLFRPPNRRISLERGI